MLHKDIETLIIECESLTKELTLDSFADLESKIKHLAISIQNISWGEKTEQKKALLSHLIEASKTLILKFENLKTEVNKLRSNQANQNKQIQAFYDQA